MKYVALFLLLLVPFSALAQDSVDTYGKTEAEILSMGMQKWYDFYTSKAGDSTAAMSNGWGIYAEVAGKRNDKLMAEHSDKKAGGMKLRNLLQDFGAQSVSISSDKSGGGTMWGPVSASMAAELEDVVYATLGGDQPKSKHVVVSSVTKLFGKISSEIEAIHKDKSASDYFKYDVAVDSLAQMKKDYAQLVEIAKGMDRANSDRVIGFCQDWAKSAASSPADPAG
jgi:hypothetical protein